PAIHSFPTRRSSDLVLHLPSRLRNRNPIPTANTNKHGNVKVAHLRTRIKRAHCAAGFPFRVGPDHRAINLIRLSLIARAKHQARSEEHTSELQSLAY